MDAGYAEFNDSTSKIRGVMVAGKGTFSGIFSAQNVNAISHINVRDGAVSAHIGFGFPSGAKTAAFTVPANSETSVADIIIPLNVWAEGPPDGRAATASLYKNGVLLSTAYISLPLRRSSGFFPYIAPNAGFLQCIRFVDTELSGTSHYMVELTDTYFRWEIGSTKIAGVISLNLSGPITVGFRKR